MTASRAYDGPLVSVVVPTYDRPELLRVALGSVLAQSYPSIEVLVADDGPNGQTAEVVGSFGDGRVRYLKHRAGIDALENCRRAFEQATGKYVAGVHDDDYWHPRFLERLVEPLEHDDELVLAFSDIYVVDADGEIDERATEEAARRWGRTALRAGKHRPFFEIAMSGAAATQLAIVFRNGLVDWALIPERASVVFDRWLAYLACRGGGGAHYVPERLAYSRAHDQNATTTNPAAWAQSGEFCYSAFAKDPALTSVRPMLTSAAADYAATESVVRLRAGDALSARRAALRSLGHRPTLRASLLLGASLVGTGPAQGLLRMLDSLRVSRAGQAGRAGRAGEGGRLRAGGGRVGGDVSCGRE